jgi:hypothetical protein
METGLSAKEQATAAGLRGLALLDDQRMGFWRAALPLERGRESACASPTGSPATRTQRTERPCLPNCSTFGGFPPHAAGVAGGARRPDAVRALHLTRPQVRHRLTTGRQLGSALVRRVGLCGANGTARRDSSAPGSGRSARHSAEPGGAHSTGLLARSAHRRRRIGGESLGRNADPDRGVATSNSPKVESRLRQPRSLSRRNR